MAMIQLIEPSIEKYQHFTSHQHASHDKNITKQYD
jgi:hypothetical protein